MPPPTAEPRDPRDPLGAEFIFISLGKAKFACFHQPFLESFTESPSSSGTGWTLGALANCSQQNIPPHTISTSLAFSISLSFLAFFKEFSTSLFPSVSKQAAWHVVEHCSDLRDVTPSDSCAPQCSLVLHQTWTWRPIPDPRNGTCFPGYLKCSSVKMCCTFTCVQVSHLLRPQTPTAATASPSPSQPHLVVCPKVWNPEHPLRYISDLYTFPQTLPPDLCPGTGL